jgi:GAF domain-containing protein
VTFSARDLREALKGLDHLRYGTTDLEQAIGLIVSTTHDLFSVDGAALMLMDRELLLRNAAASDSRMDLLESLQVEHGVGPCISAFQEKTLVCSEDLAEEERFGAFSSAAVEAGLRAVLASPIPYATDAVGVVAVFSGKPHAWTPEGELALTSFTDLAALAIVTTMQSEERGQLTDQLKRALDARVVIEQAKGVLVGRDGVDPRRAFEELRAQARRSRRMVSDLAAEIVRESLTRPSG